MKLSYCTSGKALHFPVRLSEDYLYKLKDSSRLVMVLLTKGKIFLFILDGDHIHGGAVYREYGRLRLSHNRSNAPAMRTFRVAGLAILSTKHIMYLANIQTSMAS